jgi:hypothetical protein
LVGRLRAVLRQPVRSRPSRQGKTCASSCPGSEGHARGRSSCPGCPGSWTSARRPDTAGRPVPEDIQPGSWRPLCAGRAAARSGPPSEGWCTRPLMILSNSPRSSHSPRQVGQCRSSLAQLLADVARVALKGFEVEVLVRVDGPPTVGGQDPGARWGRITEEQDDCASSKNQLVTGPEGRPRDVKRSRASGSGRTVRWPGATSPRAPRGPDRPRGGGPRSRIRRPVTAAKKQADTRNSTQQLTKQAAHLSTGPGGVPKPAVQRHGSTTNLHIG